MLNKIAVFYYKNMDLLASVCKNDSYTFLMFIVYKGLLDIIYLKCVGNYHAFFYISISPANVINGWIITFLMAFFFAVYYRQNTSSSILLILLNMLYFLPMITYCSFGGGSASFLSWGLVYWGILSLCQLKVPLVLPEIKEDNTKKINFTLILTALISLPILFVWIKYAHCRLLIGMNFENVYAVRAESMSYSLPVALNYIMNMVPMILGVLTILSLNKRMYMLLCPILLLMIIDYSIAGSKSVFFLPFILIGGYVLYKKEYITLILPGGVVIELLAIAEFFFGKGYIVTLLFRRMGFMLGQLSEYYYRFFNENSIDFFRQGVLGKLGFESVYSQGISYVIGNNFETQTVNCNNGLLADVWGNLGLIGIVVMPIIIIFCFRLLDFATHGIESKLLIGIIVYYSMIFANTQWSTALLTHGYLLLCILMMLFPKYIEYTGEQK